MLISFVCFRTIRITTFRSILIYSHALHLIFSTLFTTTVDTWNPFNCRFPHISETYIQCLQYQGSKRRADPDFIIKITCYFGSFIRGNPLWGVRYVSRICILCTVWRYQWEKWQFLFSSIFHGFLAVFLLTFFLQKHCLFNIAFLSIFYIKYEYYTESFYQSIAQF